MIITLSISHIDTCLSCYLTDHHNREGECLLGVMVDGVTTWRQVYDALKQAWSDANVWDILTREQFDIVTKLFAEELESEFSNLDLDSYFDDSLEINDSERDWEDPCQAWFLVSYEIEESDSD